MAFSGEKTRPIGLRNIDVYQGVGDGYANASALRMQNSTLYYGITANTRDLRVWYRNTRTNGSGYTASDSALSIKLGHRLFSSAGVGQGAGFTTFNSGTAFTVPQTTNYLSGVLSINNVVAGQYLLLSQWVDAGSGNKAPGTRRENSVIGSGAEQREYGASLTAVIDGTLSSACAAKPSDQYIYAPVVVGKTVQPALGGGGHSLMQGIGADYGYNFLQIAAETLGCQALNTGVGGSGATSLPPFVKVAGLTDAFAYIHSINDINDAGTASTSSATFLTSQSAQVAANIKKIQSQGCRVIICTEGLNETGTAAYDRANVIRADWNAFVRSYGTSVGSVTGGTGLGADAICDIASVLETSVGNNVGVSGVSGIHWGQTGHELAGAKLAADLTTLGWLDAQSNAWKEQVLELFEGSATTNGATFTDADGVSWTQFAYNAYGGKLKKNAGALEFGTSTDGDAGNYLIHGTSLSAAHYKAEITGTFVTPTGVSMGPGFFFSGGGNNGVELYCYKGFFLTASRFVVQGRNSSGATSNLIDFNLSSSLANGDPYLLIPEWTQNGTSTDLTVTVYRGKTSLGTGTMTADTTSSLQSGGTWGVMYQGNSGNTPTAAPLFSRVALYKYDPITIGSVTCNATTQMEPGMTRNLSVTVKDDTGTVASGQVVTSSYTGDSGLSTSATATSDVNGIATFALVADGGMSVGDSGTFTFSCGGQSADSAITIVSAISGGGGAEMTVEDTVKVRAVSSEWTEIKQRDTSSLTGKAFLLGMVSPAQTLVEYAVVDDSANIQVATEFSPKSPMFNGKNVATGKKAYIRGKGVDVDVAVEIGTI